MKKIGFVLLAVLSLALGSPVSANTDRTMKISYGGEVKFAKDIGEGKGINIVLPELDVDNFYINAIELAVFERQETETEWHIYKDDKGRESKKQYIENPQSLNVSVDFGDIDGYRDRAKYKLAYRYYVQSTDDMSKIFIAGKDTKDGWRLVGEQNPIRATDDGFMFYLNTNPELNVRSFAYNKHTFTGDVLEECTPDELSNVRFPMEAFMLGVTVNYTVEDYDSEDELSVQYTLIDELAGTVICSGYLDDMPDIYASVRSDFVTLELTVYDSYGGAGETERYSFNLDMQAPFVTSEFDDLGYVLSGNRLFSDFEVYDDEGILMTEGSVYATIAKDNTAYSYCRLEYLGDGVYRLDKEVFDDGTYTIMLDMFDKSSNIGLHTFYQTLDNTEPSAEFVNDMVDSNATKYSSWMNVSKNVIINASDDVSGINKYSIYLDNSRDKQQSLQEPVREYTIINPVTNAKTGKLKYSGYIFDNAKAIDRRNNRADESSEGNRLSFEKYVWLDKTPPVIECDVDETEWYETPAVFNINFADNRSSVNVNDASGIASRWYAITDSVALPTDWNRYDGYIEVNNGGVFYIHLKAVDNAGNEATLTKKVRTNEVSMLLGRVEPTEDYKHTIYYRETDFYVIKNTAYNTKFHFLLNDTDTEDGIRTDVRLVSRDNPEKYAISSSVVYPDGNTQRDVVFNMPYIDEADNKLPDGVYDMLISISEIKNDGEVIKTHDNINVCEIIIKRTAPPTPVINVSGGMVDITYPEETTAPSLNNSFVSLKYKRQYKIVKDGVDVSGYVNYTDSFPIDNMTVTALYTDIAGNVSVATKRIFDTDGGGGSPGIDATVEGSNTTVEESRAGNVYYIGTRREKQKGINSDIFDFIN